MYMLICGDLVPTERNMDFFINADCDVLFGGGLKNLLEDAAYKIVNLEVPLTDAKTKIQKCGPSIKAKKEAVNALKTINFNLVDLANNHIMDFGINGLTDTLSTLKKNGIEFIGAGNNIEQASKPFTFLFNKKKIGVYACVENEFSVSTKKEPGANPFDALETFECVKLVKEKNDYEIVLYHGGKEFYRYPSPELQKRCRKMVDSGADLVICQHSHCIGSIEKYKDATIVYGQGNFIFDRKDDEYWNNGLIVRIDEDLNIDYLPIVKHESVIRLAEVEERQIILEQLSVRSNYISRDGYIQDRYNELAQEKIYYYLKQFIPNRNSFGFKLINFVSRGKYTDFLVKRMQKNQLSVILDYIMCEAHHELLIAGLKTLINKQTSEE